MQLIDMNFIGAPHIAASLGKCGHVIVRSTFPLPDLGRMDVILL